MSKADLRSLEALIERRGIKHDYANELMAAAIDEYRKDGIAWMCQPPLKWDRTIIAVSALTLKQRIAAAKRTLGVGE